MSKSKKPPYFLRVRRYAKAKFVTVWLIKCDHGPESGLMWGEMLPQGVEVIAQATGLPVIEERSPLEFQEGKGENIPPECASLKEQADLFSGVNDAAQ